MERYAILQSISQRKDGTLSEESTELARIANVISRAGASGSADEGEFSGSSVNVASLNEREQRAAENWALKTNHWIPISKVFELGLPGPSGSESDTYISRDGYVYKQNNLLHCSGSIVKSLTKYILHNIIFPDSAYSFVGFTGFTGRSVFPVVRQCFIEGGVPATQNEIDCYMAALGFVKTDTGKFQNSQYILSDLLPKNAIRDNTGDIFIIDAEISITKE